MNYPPDFIHQLKERAGDRCECERRDCHEAEGQCAKALVEGPGAGRWTPVMTGDRITFPPVASNYIALCEACVAPRTGAQRQPGS